MNGLLEALNHLLTAAVARQGAGGAVQVRAVTLEPEGLRAVLRLDHAQWRGEAVVRLRAGPRRGREQTLQLMVERWPETLPAALEPLRAMLERARVTVALELPDADEPGGEDA